MKKLISNEHYFEETFDKLVLPNLNIDDTEFEECTFNDCDFTSSNFAHCKFIHCSFNRCNLSLIKIPSARFFAVDFIECKLLGIDWTVAHWPTFNLNAELTFKQCILNDASFFGLTLNELEFDDCKLHDVDFREGDFSNSSMFYCDFKHSLFMRTKLIGVDFTDSFNFTIDVLENQLSQATFSRMEALSLLDGLDIKLVD